MELSELLVASVVPTLFEASSVEFSSAIASVVVSEISAAFSVDSTDVSVASVVASTFALDAVDFALELAPQLASRIATDAVAKAMLKLDVFHDFSP